MGQITATRNLVAIEVVRHAGQLRHSYTCIQSYSNISSHRHISME